MCSMRAVIFPVIAACLSAVTGTYSVYRQFVALLICSLCLGGHAVESELGFLEHCAHDHTNKPRFKTNGRVCTHSVNKMWCRCWQYTSDENTAVTSIE